MKPIIQKFSDFQKEEFINNDEFFHNLFESKSPEEVEKEFNLELGRKGELADYLREHGQVFTFGILKHLFKDALDYKKKREINKGTYKAFHRMVPMIGSLLFFPISLISFAFGMSRALHKILIPIIHNPNKTYNSFLFDLIDKSMMIAEGEYKIFMKKDWFYNLFVLKDNLLIEMIRKEHLIIFAQELANNMELEDDFKPVPKNYIENELKLFLNEKFQIDPPLQLKS